ncbi:transmembrane protease serine 3-like protein [Aphelenchoides avenae]|nr:transmembrane protease serine 3-like protein [Aphelenchus avenae]
MILTSFLVFLAVGITSCLQKSDCGRNPRIGVPEKVIGGHVAADGNWPWAVCVETSVRDKVACCSGSVISPRYVLIPPENVTIRVGSVNISSFMSQAVAVTEFIIHPGYKIWEDVDDVVLLKLETPLTFGERIQPICLATHYEEVPGEEGFVVGYGMYNVEQHLYDNDGLLRENILEFHNVTDCENRGTVEMPREKPMCAGGYDRGVNMVSYFA